MNASKDRQQCYFCQVSEPSALEEHHLVPQRHNGSDEPENLVMLCGSCHNKIESLYDDEFYERVSAPGQEIAAEGTAHTGRSVDPSESKDRMLPPDSPHVQVESLIYFPSMDTPSRNYYQGEPVVTQAKGARFGGGGSQRQDYDDNYRLHCSYCHTVFTKHQHSDAARHLRVRHGIENPYEQTDTHHYSNSGVELSKVTEEDST